MFTTVALLVMMQFAPPIDMAYFPYQNRVDWQLNHYKTVNPFTGQINLGPEPAVEHFYYTRWNNLTPAQQMGYRDLWLASHKWVGGMWVPDPMSKIANPVVSVGIVVPGVQLQPGNPVDEDLTDRRLTIGGSL